MRVLAAILLALVVTGPAAAEYGRYTTYYYGTPYYALPYDPREAPLFDDKVFNLKPKARPLTNKKGRTFDDAVDYSKAQRKAWIKQCQPLMDEDFKKYQECFQSHVEHYEMSKSR